MQEARYGRVTVTLPNNSSWRPRECPLVTPSARCAPVRRLTCGWSTCIDWCDSLCGCHARVSWLDSPPHTPIFSWEPSRFSMYFPKNLLSTSDTILANMVSGQCVMVACTRSRGRGGYALPPNRLQVLPDLALLSWLVTADWLTGVVCCWVASGLPACTIHHPTRQ